MYKVVIVDDEIYVVHLIRKLINWEKFNMEVVDSAYDGESALELVKNILPDLIIVDVRMPGYDGISFMDKVREFDEKVKFIVISGHKQFDYAKGAMRNKVEDYLLKPINKEELESVLYNVEQKLKKEEEAHQNVQVLEKELDSSKRKIRENFLRELLKKNYRVLDKSFENINNEYFVNFLDEKFLIVSFHLEMEYTESLDVILKNIQFKLETDMLENCSDIITIQDKNIIIALLNYKASDKEVIKEKLQRFLKVNNKEMEKFKCSTLTLCIGEEGTILKIGELIQSNENCMLVRITYGVGTVVEYCDIKKNPDILSKLMQYGQERLSAALEDFDEKEIKYIIKDIYSRAFYHIEEDNLIYYEVFEEILKQTYIKFSNLNMISGKYEEFCGGYLKEFIYASCERNIIHLIWGMIHQIIIENQLNQRNYEVPAIKVVKKYIMDHYAEDISLSSAAELVNLNPVYLSRLFKKEENTNFLDYLNQYRIEVAKKLLKDVQYNVIEVSMMSGFNNTRYFSKLFKKLVGITPSEYRKRHIG